jgi:hypothetical protein
MTCFYTVKWIATLLGAFCIAIALSDSGLSIAGKTCFSLCCVAYVACCDGIKLMENK